MSYGCSAEGFCPFVGLDLRPLQKTLRTAAAARPLYRVMTGNIENMSVLPPAELIVLRFPASGARETFERTFASRRQGVFAARHQTIRLPDSFRWPLSASEQLRSSDASPM
jgi:hypothetical protein